jgi:hypothetical protein
MKRSLLAAPLLAAALAGCASVASQAAGPASSSAPSPRPAATAARPSAAATHASPAATGCALRTRFDYIVRTTEPGTQATAQEIGNVDLGNCTPALQDFAETAGQAQGECTTIARARANRGYDVNAVPAPPLRRVLERAGPGCAE